MSNILNILSEETFADKMDTTNALLAAIASGDGGIKFSSFKDLQKLTLENILEINGITIPEMSVITELQKQVKAGTLYSYLGGGENEQSD